MINWDQLDTNEAENFPEYSNKSLNKANLNRFKCK